MKELWKYIVTHYEIPKNKNSYEILLLAEEMITDTTDLTVEVTRIDKGIKGIASSNKDMHVGVFVEDLKESSDCIIKPDEFNSQYEITDIYVEENNLILK